MTETERQLIDRITVETLRISLTNIRQAAEGIWNPETPRIVKDYTSHDIHHSERVIGYIGQLLRANDARPLSDSELYVLLASAYLHDIGMQCDVLLFPDIKTAAEKLGAKFETEFTAESSNGFGINEQKAIRENHGFLAAAWIDYAFRSGESSLGFVAKSIPDEYVLDLMHACMFHSRLSINDCPECFRVRKTERKRLIAAMLRFADELDIDATRVSLETVRNFRLSPANSLFWWIHNKTTVEFTSRSMVRISVRLVPDDVEKYSAAVRNAFITPFKCKNEVVLDVLAKNDIPIIIGVDSDVVAYDYTEPLPVEIVRLLAMTEESNRRPDSLSLASLGAARFVAYAVETSATKQMIHLVLEKDLAPDAILGFAEFITILEKYSILRASPVSLDAKILPVLDGRHALYVWGVRDQGLRNTGNATYFPAYQLGAWSCVLEDALCNGLSAEEIRLLRETLHLFPQHGVEDAEFFSL